MSDVYYEAYGKTTKEVFENAAVAMFEIICKIEQVEPKKTITVEVKGDDEKSLLYNWLQELIAQVDIEEMFFSKFNILKIDDCHLLAEISGEEISQEKGNTVVKAVTNFKFDLKKSDSNYLATVSLDI